MFIEGELNRPGPDNLYWTVEVALPISSLRYNNSEWMGEEANKFIREGDMWRINFSRVEWHTIIKGGRYLKDPSCQSCPSPGSPNEDNWVWSPIGVIAMHNPEKWGFLQFSRKHPRHHQLGDIMIHNREWTIREVRYIHVLVHSIEAVIILTNSIVILGILCLTASNDDILW